MNCQTFGDLLQQYGNIITNVHCLSVEVNNVVGNYFANILEVTCLSLTNSNESQNLITKKLSFSSPATYLFLVDKKTFSKFFIGKLIEKLEEFQNVENEINTLDKFFKELEEILENENSKEVGNNNRKTDKNKKKKEKLREELKRCLNLRNYNYFPLYVGSTNNFSRRYKEFRCSLRCGEIYPNKFGGNLHQHLITLTNFSSMKMCLVVFYTDSEDKAQCIESSILNHNDFCKIFNKNNSNKNNSNCPNDEFENIANKIIDAIKNLQSFP